MVSGSVNEPPRPNSEHCPVCGIKIPFSLAMHMMTAHSQEADNWGVGPPVMTLPNDPVSPDQHT